jgi:hypothetical protein
MADYHLKMSFERFDSTTPCTYKNKLELRKLEHAAVLSFQAHSLRFNAAASRALMKLGAKRMVILWDQSSRQVALQVAPETDAAAYRIFYQRRWSGQAAEVRCAAFTERLETLLSVLPAATRSLLAPPPLTAKKRGRPRKAGAGEPAAPPPPAPRKAPDQTLRLILAWNEKSGSYEGSVPG